MSDSTKERIRKLLALAESAKEVGSIHEAEVATQKALHLLWENGLSEADVRDYKQSELEFRVYAESDYWYGRSYICQLIGTLSEVCLCAGVRTIQGRQVTFNLHGRPENLQVFDYLFKLCIRTFEKYGKEMQANLGRSLYMPSFFRGCVIGLSKKIREQKQADENVHAIEAVILCEKTNLWNFINEQYPDMGKARESRTTDDRASLRAGKVVGENTELTTALPAESRAQSNLLK
jgi:hypothetical protein